MKFLQYLKEIDRREQAKQIASKPKKLKEENGTIGVAGLGLASGSPAVDDEQSGNYVAQNTADSDQKDNILHLWMKAAQHHDKRLGFKEFNPKVRNN